MLTIHLVLCVVTKERSSNGPPTLNAIVRRFNRLKHSHAKFDNACVIKTAVVLNLHNSNSRFIQRFGFYKTKIMSVRQTLKYSRESTPDSELY